MNKSIAKILLNFEFDRNIVSGMAICIGDWYWANQLPHNSTGSAAAEKANSKALVSVIGNARHNVTMPWGNETL